MLSGDQLVDFELRLADLIAEQEQVIEQLRKGAEVVQVDSAFGRVSRADSLLQQAMAQDGLRRAEEELTALHLAAQRLEEGTFGLCVRCQGEIDLIRLEARPETPLCGNCASAAE